MNSAYHKGMGLNLNGLIARNLAVGSVSDNLSKRAEC